MENAHAKQELIVDKTIKIKADAMTVWDALTNPEMTRQYFFNCEVHSNWEVGGDITWTGNYQGKHTEVKGKVLQVEIGRLLRYTAWSKESGLKDIPSNHTIITARLHEEDGETILNVTDENFGYGDEAEKRYQDSVKGWDMVLHGLKELVEEGEVRTGNR
jgi:uncharacterized protein YndB with AHSA1/START domain